jgi:hypothetical protein
VEEWVIFLNNDYFIIGGAIRADNRPFTCKNCSFLSCTSAASGGAIGCPVTSTAQVSCENCLFQFCSAAGNGNADGNGYYGSGGGAIYCVWLTCKGCEFVSCTALRGGAISAPRANATGDATKTVTVENCNFISCSCTGDGGAINIRRYNFHMSGCGYINFNYFNYFYFYFFIGIYYNRGVGFGAVCVEAKYNVTFDDNTFIGNVKTSCQTWEKGAALVIWLQDETADDNFDLHVYNCYFAKNKDLNCNQGNDLGTYEYNHHLESNYFTGSCSSSDTPRISCFFFLFVFFCVF